MEQLESIQTRDYRIFNRVELISKYCEAMNKQAGFKVKRALIAQRPVVLFVGIFLIQLFVTII